jgi:hypothetical protein
MGRTEAEDLIAVDGAKDAMRLSMANADDGYCDLITALGNCSGNARGPFVLADCAREVGRPTPNLFNTEAQGDSTSSFTTPIRHHRTEPARRARNFADYSPPKTYRTAALSASKTCQPYQHTQGRKARETHLQLGPGFLLFDLGPAAGRNALGFRETRADGLYSPT